MPSIIPLQGPDLSKTLTNVLKIKGFKFIQKFCRRD